MLPSTLSARSKSTCEISVGMFLGPCSPEPAACASEAEEAGSNHVDYMLLIPPELWQQIFLHLDIPDLLVCSRVCHAFRHLALDPHLHRQRRHLTRKWLNLVYPSRPTCKDLYDRNILQSRQHLAPYPCQNHMQTRAKLARIFVQDSLRRGLSKRPTKEELIERGVVKKGGNLAPQIVSLERQKAVDVLRGFLSGTQRPCYELAIKRGLAAPPPEKKPVRVLTRMFSYWKEPTKPASEAPPRAKVRKMTLLFESLSKAAGSGLYTSNAVTAYSLPCSCAASPVLSKISFPAAKRSPRLHYDGVATIRQRFVAVL